MHKITNWGRYPTIEAKVFEPRDYAESIDIVNRYPSLIARGNGRCYGDSSLGDVIISSLKWNKILRFDYQNGFLTCESGVILDDILQLIVPYGWFLPVVPGTKYITIGGAVASNIHGKNHHQKGAFSQYVSEIELIDEQGNILVCNHNKNSTLFANTMGGMGLTGIIVTVSIQLKRIQTAYIRQKTIKAKNLNEIIRLFREHDHYSYSVAWIDCLALGNALGRSVLILGEHAALDELDGKLAQDPLKHNKKHQVNIPFSFPSFVLNRCSVKCFNFLYYHKQMQTQRQETVHYEPFFFPLDAITNWNRIYGKTGFVQYQFVLPFENGVEGLREILTRIASSGMASFLAVLKAFGKADDFSSPISFHMPGYTLALDFKMNQNLFRLLDDLDRIVLENGGRFYLTKDARMKKETFHAAFPNTFMHPKKFNSLQSQRLNL